MSHREALDVDLPSVVVDQIYYFDLNTGKYFLLTDGVSKNGSTSWFDLFL